jgi:large subunit ribosomal protein L6
MSRVGKEPVIVPEGVKVSIQGGVLSAEGPKGSAQMSLDASVDVAFDEAARQITVALADLGNIGIREARQQRAMWGTTQRLISNIIVGVTAGYTKQVQVVGVGYSAKVDGKNLLLRCGFANELCMPIPENITVDPPQPGNLAISGAGQMPCVTVTMHSVDKQAVGQFAAAVRRLRPPEPYKGKGIRYLGEDVKRKAGKALAGTAG